jgi:hypothetical protein
MEVKSKEGLGVHIFGGQLWTPLQGDAPSVGKGHSHLDRYGFF